MDSWARRTWHRSSRHAEAQSHKTQPEALTNSIYNYVLGGFREKKKEKKKKKIGADDLSLVYETKDFQQELSFQMIA